MINRLQLIRSRFALLRNAGLGNAETFTPVPAPRHSLTGGGVKFKSNPIEIEEPLPADFVVPNAQDVDYQPLVSREQQEYSNAWARLIEDVESMPLRLTA